MSSFLHRYAERYPNVQVRLIEAIGWSDIQAMLERGEIHLGQTLVHAVEPGDQRFASHPFASVELLAACNPRFTLGEQGAIEIDRLRPYPLLLLEAGYIIRRTFDAACRLAGFQPNIRFESRTPHTLLSMADNGHGVAIIPSSLQTLGYALRIVSVTYRGSPLREPLTLFWDKRRAQPRYATAFCEMLADHIRDVFPITRPAEPENQRLRSRSPGRPMMSKF